MPAAAMLEAGRAAVQALVAETRSSGAPAALAAASIPAPLILPTPGSNGALPAVRIAVMAGGAIAVESAGRAGALTANLLAVAATCQPLSALQAKQGASRLQAWLAGFVPQPSAHMAATGTLETQAEQVGHGYICHPATIDATLHLGLLTSLSGRENLNITVPAAPHVPVGAVFFAGNTISTSHGAAPIMWCEPGSVSASVTVASYALLSSGSSGPAFTLQELQSKAVGGSMVLQHAGVHLASYAIDWQAAEPAQLVASARGAHHSATNVLLTNAMGKLSLSHCYSITGVFVGLQRSLRLLQQQHGSTIELGPTAGLGAMQQPGGCVMSVSSAALTLAVQGMLKTVAAETNDSVHASCQLSDPLLPAALRAGLAEHNVNVFGPSHLHHGILMSPQLQQQSGVAAECGAGASDSVTVSGGLGALGILVTGWLLQCDNKPSSITLLGRSTSSELPAVLQTGELTAVSSLQCDSASTDDSHAALCFHSRRTTLYIHAGGVLRDAMLHKQTAAGMRSVLAPKLDGAVNAAAALARQPVQRTLLFSSVASLLGNVGQSNYAAANAVLDALAHNWQAQGTVATSLQWGPWAGGGMVTAAVATGLRQQGVGLVQPVAALSLMQRLLHVPVAAPAAAAPLVVLDWQRMLRPRQRDASIFASVLPAQNSGGGASGTQHLASGPVGRDRSKVGGPSLAEVQEEVARLAASVLGGGELGTDIAFMTAGLDSLGEVCAAYGLT